MKIPNFTPDQIAKWTKEEIKRVRERALKQTANDLVVLCDAELEKRKPPKKPKSEQTRIGRAGQYVSELHFICPEESEVERNSSGLMTTGTWVVDEAHAEAAVKYGSLVALHTTRAEPSYLQGKIKGWKKQARQPRNADGQLVSNSEGIEFQFEPTNDRLPWKGGGAGEKGYAWAPIPN
jgi:hypothetical protein